MGIDSRALIDFLASSLFLTLFIVLVMFGSYRSVDFPFLGIGILIAVLASGIGCTIAALSVPNLKWVRTLVTVVASCALFALYAYLRLPTE